LEVADAPIPDRIAVAGENLSGNVCICIVSKCAFIARNYQISFAAIARKITCFSAGWISGLGYCDPVNLSRLHPAGINRQMVRAVRGAPDF